MVKAMNMKKIIFLSLILSLIIGSCTQQEGKSPLEGAWRCVYMGGPVSADTSFQAMIKEGQIKMYSKKYWTFVGYFQGDSTGYNLYGGGTYTLNGDKYEEHIMYHNDKSNINIRYKALDEVRNDTLYHRYNSDTLWGDSYILRKGFSTEKYVRLK
jgi:hypothetical protein